MNYRKVSSHSGYLVRSAEETDKVTATDRRVEFFVMGYARRPSEGSDSCKHVDRTEDTRSLCTSDGEADRQRDGRHFHGVRSSMLRTRLVGFPSVWGG